MRTVLYLLFLAGALQASLLTSVNGSGSFLDLNRNFGCSDTGTSAASCTVTTPGDAFHSASGSYQANAQYNQLDATSMSSVYDLHVGYLDGTSAASLSDTFLLTGGNGGGTLVFTAEYWGFGAGESCDSGACLSNSTVTLNTFTRHPNLGIPTPVTLSFDFSFGTVFQLNASVSAFSSALGDETARQTAHLKIDSIEVHDTSGALMTNFAVTTGSGATYAFATPEPGTYALAMAALLSLAAIRHRSVMRDSFD